MSGTGLQSAGIATMSVVGGQAGINPIGYGYYPQEGSRCISAQYSWTSQAGYYEDLSQIVARGIETSIQGVFIDNSQCTLAATMLIEGTGHVLVCPASSQGIFPCFFTANPAFQLTVSTTQASAVTRLYLINVPPGGPGVWHI